MKKRKFEYKNHYQMKQNRIKKLKQTKYKCEICGEQAKVVHHKDESKDNHNMSNLLVVCSKCHGVLHTKDTHAEKKESTAQSYVRKYGMTLKVMSQTINRSTTYIIARLKTEKQRGELLALLRGAQKCQAK